MAPGSIQLFIEASHFACCFGTEGLLRNYELANVKDLQRANLLELHAPRKFCRCFDGLLQGYNRPQGFPTGRNKSGWVENDPLLIQVTR